MDEYEYEYEYAETLVCESEEMLCSSELETVRKELQLMDVTALGPTKSCSLCGFPMEAGISPDILTYPMKWEWACPCCLHKEVSEDPHASES